MGLSYALLLSLSDSSSSLCLTLAWVENSNFLTLNNSRLLDLHPTWIQDINKKAHFSKATMSFLSTFRIYLSLNLSIVKPCQRLKEVARNIRNSMPWQHFSKVFPSCITSISSLLNKNNRSSRQRTTENQAKLKVTVVWYKLYCVLISIRMTSGCK